MLFKFLNLNYTEGLLDWRLKSYLNFYSPPLSWKYSSVTGLKVTNFLGIWQFFYELAVVTFSSNMLSNSHLVILWMYQSYSRNMPRTFLEFFYEKSSRNVKILFLWIGNSRNTSITILRWAENAKSVQQRHGYIDNRNAPPTPHPFNQ